MIDEPDDETATATTTETDTDVDEENRRMIRAAYIGADAIVVSALENGADVDCTDAENGFCALHIAIGANNLPLTRTLIEDGNAAFFPDGFGRWPSLIAAECEVDEQLTDYVAEQEARFLKENRSS